MIFEALFAYAHTTRRITVRVQPNYLPDQSDPAAGRWAWSYHIRLENHGDVTVQLLTRHWIIRDATGRVQTVQGDGVIGDQPEIAPGGSYDYVSGCPLATASGQMEGSYGMVDAAGIAFEITIPTFALVSPAARRRAH
jgi:ApaG protein